MEANQLYRFAADLLLLGHALFVAFVVLGLVFIFAGNWSNWSWVRNPYFRFAHLAAIVVVVVQSWIGVICPLTIWEMALRERAGDAVYAGSFIANWLDKLLYYQAPAWVFVVAYSLFGALVVVAWFRVRPRPFSK